MTSAIQAKRGVPQASHIILNCGLAFCSAATISTPLRTSFDCHCAQHAIGLLMQDHFGETALAALASMLTMAPSIAVMASSAGMATISFSSIRARGALAPGWPT
jgi:hypothetical protein